MSDERSMDEIFFGSVTVGERGQIVIPADARHKYSISPGERLLVFGHPNNVGLMMVKMSGMSAFISMMQAVLDMAETDTSEADETETSG